MMSQEQTVSSVNVVTIVIRAGSSITDADLCGNKYPYSLARRQAPGRCLGIEPEVKRMRRSDINEISENNGNNGSNELNEF